MNGFNELNLRIEENGVPVGYLLHRTAAEAQRALWFEHEQRQDCRSESFHEGAQELDDHRLSATQQQKNGWNVTQNRDVSGFGRFRPITSNGFDKLSERLVFWNKQSNNLLLVLESGQNLMLKTWFFTYYNKVMGEQTVQWIKSYQNEKLHHANMDFAGQQL